MDEGFNQVLQRFDNCADEFTHVDVHEELHTKGESYPQAFAEANDTLKAELFAFGIASHEAGEASDWGTHFGPFVTAGEFEHPPLKALTSEMVEYWKERATISRHPRLRARYADAAWDLAIKVPGGRRDVEMARLAIDAYIDDSKLAGSENCQISGLQRALFLSLKINDGTRIGATREALLALHKKIADPRYPLFVFFHFDSLYESRKKVGLTENQIDDMTQGLESFLRYWANPENEFFSPWSARDAGERLVQYYRSGNKPEEVERVVRTYTKCFSQVAGEANGMLAHSLLEQAHQDLLKHGLRSNADSLVPDLKAAGRRAREDMVSISIPFSVPQNVIEEACQELTDGDLETAVGRIAGHFAPDEEALRNEMHELAAKSPFQYLIQTTQIDELTRSRVGGLQEDESGQLVAHLHTHIVLDSILLRQALLKMADRYEADVQKVNQVLSISPLFEPDRSDLIETALRFHLDGEHIACAHILVPQIEHLLRRLLELLGGITMSLDSETRTYREKDLGTVLRDPLMERFWKEKIGKDVALYLRVLLTDQRGMNARNRICHGLCPAEWFNSTLTDRLVHVLFVLSQVRLIEGTGASDAEEPESLTD